MVAVPENNHMQSIGILIVSGDAAARGALRDFFNGRQAEMQVEVWEAESAARGLAVLHRRPVDLVVLGPDVLRGGGDVISDVRRFDDRTEVIAIVDDADLGHKALGAGAYDFFLAPVDFDRFDVVLRHVSQAVEAREYSSVLAQRMERPARIGELVSQDPRMIALFTAARRLARYETPVLLIGEHGTGKETLARAMHEIGRSSRPFVTIEAASATPEQFDRAVAAAADGTLYIDDVLALAPQVAAALVSLIDGSAGRERTQSAARVIAACPESATRRCSPGTLQEDLYLRLSSAALTVPPLRDRRDDVAPIAQEILGRAENGHVELSRAGAETLARHDWPGNGDELRTVLETAGATSGDRPIEVQDLPPPLREASPAVDESIGGESRRLADIEAAHLRKALTETRGNKARAARILGLSRWALQRKLQKHRISMQELLS
ncbi:MAG TPA: sigma 54-interacting transcriptional regulator [Candidatus Binatia bacterium]|jgi:DNA-binding NtrC family response regulator